LSLTDSAVRHARPSSKPYTLNDTDGLALFVKPHGKKTWHFRFSWNGKQQRILLGRYPETRLKEARDRRDEVRSVLHLRDLVLIFCRALAVASRL